MVIGIYREIILNWILKKCIILWTGFKWHVWGRKEMHTVFWWINLKE